MYYQLQSFDPSLPASTIAWQAGALASGFTFAQFLTAVIWGKMADSEYCGRKRVLLIGLMGTGISAVGFGFSTTFWMALGFRFIGGILNGNVGVMRTMVSEMIAEKKFVFSFQAA
jgi:MFS family permease